MALLLYNIALVLLYPVYRIGALLHPRLREFHRSRREGMESVNSFFGAGKGACPIWLHAASAGELDQALGLLREIKARNPSTQVILSVFSLSVKRMEYPGADLVFRMPLDLFWSWPRVIRTIRPKLFVTMTWDVFPNLLFWLQRIRIPAYLSSAALAEDSPRLRFPWISLHRSVYSRFTAIGAVDEANAVRFRRLVFDPAKVAVTGDSRYDTIFYRIHNVSLKPDVEERLDSIGGPLFILGSTYDACDRKLFPVLGELLANHANWKVLIFPHHVEEHRLREVEENARLFGLSTIRFGGDEGAARDGKTGGNEDGKSGQSSRTIPPDVPIVVVDRLGILALAYKRAAFCYVGGAFHHRIHNVGEPAALGLPVITGPAIETSPTALELQEKGLLFVSHTSKDFFAIASRLMENENERRRIAGEIKELLAQKEGSSRIFCDTFLAGKLGPCR